MSQSIRSVTDKDFDILSPAFIVINGRILHIIAFDQNIEREMIVGDSVEYEQHGTFHVCSINERERCAVINHTTRGGKTLQLEVPPEEWLVVSNGVYQTCKPDYAKVVLSRNPQVQAAIKANLQDAELQPQATGHDNSQLLVGAFPKCAATGSKGSFLSRLRVRICPKLPNFSRSENRSSGD